MHKFNKIIALAIFFALTGCASSTWTPVEEATFVAPKDSFSVDLPSGWINYTRARNTKVITKDGLELQSIRILRDDHKKAFSAIEKDSNPNMLPQEVAENLIAEIKATYELDNIDTLSNDPALIDGQPGFRVLLEYKTERGLRRKYLAYGFVNDKGLYTMIYTAPTLHYYDRDVQVFESVVKSFKIQ